MTLLTPYTERPRCGCLSCPPKPVKLELKSEIHPGFGVVSLLRDGDYTEDDFGDDATLADVERIAAADPDHDWRLHISGPLSGQIYQRQPDGWLFVKIDRGFA